jgi:hypothetical protein
MHIVKRVPPGRPGTKKWMERYGDRFVCLRYGIDSTINKRFKTVEIIVEENDFKRVERTPSNKIMHLRIEYGEIDLARLVKNAGGRWNRAGRYWELAYGEVRAIGLEKRIVGNNSH